MTDCRSDTRVSVSVSRRRRGLVRGDGPSVVFRGTRVGVLSFDIWSSEAEEAFAARWAADFRGVVIGEFSMVGRRPPGGGVDRPASFKRLDSDILSISSVT